MVTSSAVVGSSAIRSVGLAGQRHGDHHALAHAAGELVRIVVERASRREGMRDQLEHLDRARLRACGEHWSSCSQDRLGDLLADRVHRVERGHRLLEDHRDLAAAQLRRISRSSRSSRSRPSNMHLAAGDRAGRVGSRPMIDSAVTVLPQPDSPTMPSVSPRRDARSSTPSTARNTPRSVWKWVLKIHGPRAACPSERVVQPLVEGVLIERVRPGTPFSFLRLVASVHGRRSSPTASRGAPR